VSIEEYLGANTPAYYAALTEVAQGTWSPQNSALGWVEFCLTAHYRQALTVLRRIRELEALWDTCEQIAQRHRLSPRAVGALVDAARGWRLRRSLYVTTTKATAGEDISDAVATNDLAAMTRAGLLNPVGEKRGRYYAPTEELTNPWQRIRSRRPIRRDSSASWRRISCAKSGSAAARSCDQVIVRSRRRGPHR